MAPVNALSMYRGEYKVWEFTLTDSTSPVNLTGAALRWVLRERAPGVDVTSDSDAVLVRTSSAAGGITVTSSTGGRFELELLSTQTNTAEARLYVWEIAILPNGHT
ncbi:MAG: hypothetical protein WC651_03170, partial [Candidatus Gracilibacteria bacterium]